MPIKYRRYTIRSKEERKILKKISERLKFGIEMIMKKDSRIEILETNLFQILLVNKKPLLFKTENRYYPTLLFKEIFDVSPRIIIDMGAISHVCNGANIMAPGVVGFKGSFLEGDIVLVVDEKHGKPIAVGEVNYNAKDLKNLKRGVVVKTLHYVGDKVWSLAKEFIENEGGTTKF
ncbi:DUF1947 domain-containing protein [Candidatus Bathyarchaeota archaeon]|nr:DUF1947 domain-containing protein [Candidatus Bathyarchaeota archaeon]